jgi:TRAP-type C4-dicarboxylate transport system permease small subunit
MKGPGTAGAILRGVDFFLRGVKWIGYVSLSGMILLTTVNVFGRYVLKKPLLGEYDMVELGMAIFGGVAMLMAAIKRHHVSVDVLLVRFSKHTQATLGRIASFVGFGTWGLLASLTLLDGVESLENGSVSATLQIPQGPFEIALSICLYLFCLTLLIQAFKPEESKEEGPPL